MERVTLRLTKKQIEDVERLVDQGEFPNRSEAIRSAVRRMLNDRDDDSEGGRPWARV